MFTPAKALKNNTNTSAETTTPFFRRAHRVMPASMRIQRKCDACEKEEKKQMQRKETVGSSSGGKTAPAIVSNVLSSGSGQPMDTGARQFMENRFGQDFGQVRIHVGGQAAESAAAIQARAYTSGKDIVFGAGEYQPGSESGRRLLAHELAHVGQQGGGIQKRPETQPSAEISYNSEMGVQRSWFGDDEESMPESESGGGILDWAKEQAGSAVDTVTQAGGDAYDWAKEQGSSAVDTVTQAGGDAYDWAKEQGSSALDTVTQAGGDAYDWAKEQGSSALDTVTQAGGDAYDWAKEQGSSAVDTVTQAGGDAYDWMKEKGSSIIDTITQAGSDVSDWVKEQGDTALNIANGVGNQGVELVSNNIQVDWNSPPGILLKDWAGQLDPKVAWHLRGKNPGDLYSFVSVPFEILQAAGELSKTAAVPAVDPAFDPEIEPEFGPESGTRPITRPGPILEPEPGPLPFPNPILLAILIFLAIIFYSKPLNEGEDELLKKEQEEQKRKQKLKKDLGDCSETQELRNLHKELQDEVDKQCKTLERSCADDIPLSCIEIKSRLQRNERCSNARKNINKKCYKGGDRGHQEAEEAARAAEEKCRDRYSKKKC